jgi:Hemerythrin HHE cation binding domain
LPSRPLAVHCPAFCAALTRHHTGEDAGAFPALAARFPELRPLLAKTAEDHVLISGIVARIEEIAASGDPALAAELHGLASGRGVALSRSRSAASARRSTPSTARRSTCSALRRTARCRR